jgi:hypothetical protein
MRICSRLESILDLWSLYIRGQCIVAYEQRDARFYFVGDPERGVALVAGVFAPDGPKELGGPTSPWEPSGAKEDMYALRVSWNRE